MKVLAPILSFFPEKIQNEIIRIYASPIAIRLISGAYWAFIGTAIARGVTLISSIIVVRFLGKVEYGELAIVVSTVSVFQTLGGFGLGLTSSKYVAEFRSKDPQKAADIMAMSAMISAATGVVSSLVMYFMAPWLSIHVLDAPHLSYLLKISALMPLLQVINGTQIGTISGLEAFRLHAIVAASYSIISVPLIILGVMWYGMEGTIYAYTVSQVIACLSNHFVVRQEAARNGIPVRFFARNWDGGMLWRFSMPAMLASMLVLPVNWACGVMLVNQPNGYAQNGLYSAANQWFTATMLFSGIASQALLPVLSECMGRGDWIKVEKVFKAGIRANALIVMPIVMVGAFASSMIMGMYGSDFSSGWPTLVICLVTAGIVSIQVPVGHVMAASNRLWTYFYMNAAWACGLLIFTYLLVENGATGVAFARLLAYFFYTIISFLYVRSVINNYV